MEDPLPESDETKQISNPAANNLANGQDKPTTTAGQAEQFDDEDLGDLITATLAEHAIPCAACKTIITTSDGISINNKFYHRECFLCGLCSKRFNPSDQIFIGIENQILCKECKDSNPEKVKTAEICVYCKKPINTAAMIALDKKWHPECFICTDCNVALTGFFRDSSGVPYCEICWLRNFAKQCRTCGDHIAEQVMTIEQHDYHVTCVTCVVCKKTFDNVLDILNIEAEFWHIDCFKEVESESESTCSASSALLGVYNKSLGFSASTSSPSTGASSRKISTVSFANAPRSLQADGAAPRALADGAVAAHPPGVENGSKERSVSRNSAKSSKCCVVS